MKEVSDEGGVWYPRSNPRPKKKLWLNIIIFSLLPKEVSYPQA